MSCENIIEVVQQDVTIEQVTQDVIIEQVGIVLQKTVNISTTYEVSLESEIQDNILKNYVQGKLCKTDGKMTHIDYRDVDENLVYKKEFFRTDGKMTHWILTRISDGETLQKNFSKNTNDELLFDYE